MLKSFNTPEAEAEAVPWFTCIMEPTRGHIAYVIVQAGDLDAAHDAALDALAEQHNIDGEDLDPVMCLGIFEGAAKCLTWGGFPC